MSELAPQGARPSGHDRAALDRSLVRGVAWTGGVKWLTQAATWVATLIVARLLSPEDYGLVGMATVYVGLLALLSESGIGTTILTIRELEGRAVEELHSVAVAAGVAGFALSCLVAKPLSIFFHQPALQGVIIALSVNFVITALRTVPQSLLRRDLRFRRTAAIEGASSIIVAATSIALAMAGFRYWTLVVATLLGSAVATVSVLVARPVRFRRPAFANMGRTLRVSRDILVGTIAWYVFENADFFVAGKVLGAAALGVYTVAWNLAYSVVEKVTGLISGVTSSIFSAAKHDAALLERYVVQITGALSLVLLPATVGVALVAPELVRSVLGQKWTAAIVPLQILVLYASVRSLTPILAQALTVAGDTRYTMMRSVVAAVCMPIGFLVGSRWGIIGVASAWIVVHAPLVVAPLFRRATTRLGVSATAYFAAIRPAAVSSVVMAIVVIAAGYALGSVLSDGPRLAVKVVLGAAVYAACLGGVFRARVMAVVNALRRASGSAQAAATGGADGPPAPPSIRPSGAAAT